MHFSGTLGAVITGCSYRDAVNYVECNSATHHASIILVFYLYSCSPLVATQEGSSIEEEMFLTCENVHGE